jgi:hypothetical protein
MTLVDLSTSPWLIRVFDHVPVSLPVMATLIALAHFISVALLGWALSPTLPGELLGWGSVYGVAGDIVHSVLVGYLMAGGYYGLREAVIDFLSLRPSLSCDDVEFGNLLTNLRHVARAPLYFWTAIALVWGFSVPLLETNWSGAEPPPLGSASMTFRQIEETLFVFIIFRTLALEFTSAFFFASVARRFARIELFDLQRVAPFSQRALRGVLVVMLFMAILSLLVIFDPDPTTSMIGVIFASSCAAALFLIPLIPLQRRIQAEKLSELARVQAAMRRDNEARIASDEDWAPRADLIVYKQQIEQVSTWTFNTPTLVRFALYVSLGIGSWLGAAFVERWLSTLLGS